MGIRPPNGRNLPFSRPLCKDALMTTYTLRTDEELACLRALFAGRMQAVRQRLFQPIPTDLSPYAEADELNKRCKFTRELRWLRSFVEYGSEFPEEVFDGCLPSYDGVGVSISENGLEDTDFDVRRDAFMLRWLLGLEMSGYVKYEFEAIA